MIYQDCGLIDYQEGWDLQETFFQKVVSIKLQNREQNTQVSTSNFILLCEHPHVYTLGKSGKKEHLLLNENQLKEKEIQYFPINRGGDITYHGPGQLVGYPILDLDNFFTDIHKYMRYLEDVVIETLSHWGLKGGRVEGLTGVWIDFENPLKARKICAMGVRASRWVTMHGFALNVNTDMLLFNHIVPCGINDKSVTSMAQEMGVEIDMQEIKRVLLQKFELVFEALIIDQV